ncbi:uncharacterized protein LOC113512360 [Galleria mellonella]|uniref:Uncharacterized protein LOC113512360 n=1 Tax=Galleria mellonella TaxID=7137 RepID=A0A6J1WEB3_GALME|nr:uncharacterized protein LOC113512360 [Galleria mellonella]
MLEPWNDSSILRPPVHTSALQTSCIDIDELRDICNNIIAVMLKQSPLHKESALLSRFLYKFDKKFRNDIGYRNFKKVNTALHTYLKLNLLKDVEYFSSTLPMNDDIYLPTRQMLEYVLIRIMSFLKIMFRICKCSKQAAVFYMDRLKRGESHWMSLMPYALLSRIWSICTVLLEHACSWYTNLYKYLDKLQLKGVKFLPDAYELPVDIELWIDLKNIDSYGRFDWSEKRHLQIDPNLVEEDGEAFDSILDYVKEINNETQEEVHQMSLPINQEIKSLQIETQSFQSVDKGESISREYFKSFFNPQTSDKMFNHSANNVTNKATLQQFLDKEETYRNDSDARSLTKHLSFMQWQTLKTSLEKLGNSLAKNRKIERKFQKIWKEKCLEYV